MDAAIFHMENFADTWSGWYKVLKSLVTLVSQEFLSWIEAMVNVFTYDKVNGEGATKELLSSTKPETDTKLGMEGYKIEGSSFVIPTGSSKKD